jgi:GNAT superfamily N-acetyltransferase
MISSTILLIHPPAVSPVIPCWDAAVVAGILCAAGLDPCHYDANLDFYREHLTANGGESGDETRANITKLSGKEFYDIPHLTGCRHKINTCLAQIRHTQQAPAGAQKQEGRRYNPFARLCEQGLVRKIFQHTPGTVIFFISSHDQILAAQTLAACIKSRYPGIQVMAVATIRWVGPYSQYFDHLVVNQGPRSLLILMDLFYQTHGVKIDPHTVLPDFNGFSLSSYLTPERVVPVDPFFFKDPVLLAEFLEDQVCSLGVQGFVFGRASFFPGTCAGGRKSVSFEIKEKNPALSRTGMHRHLSHWLSTKKSSVFFSMQVCPEEAFPEDENNLSDLFSAGLRLICWQGKTRSTRICEKTLWGASKCGIWNHVSWPDLFRENSQRAKFIVNNPNIVHSFQTRDSSENRFVEQLTDQKSDPNLIQNDQLNFTTPHGLMDYAKVQPLPGIAFWKVLGDTGWLLVYLSQFSRKSLGGIRVDMETHGVFYLGSQMRFFYQSPSDLPPGVLDQICKMVAAGGSVDTTHVRSNLERAHMIGYAMENGVIVGNSSLKHPRAVFIDRLKQTTGVDFSNFVERGYTSVRPEYRAMGVGAKLLEGLTKRAKGYKVFSIISEDNLATQKIAIRNNTKKILTYFSEKMNKEMGVWMPESMIDQPAAEAGNKGRGQKK